MGFHYMHLPPELAAQHDRERAHLRGLRDAISRQIEADLDRIDRCIATLDRLDGDTDLEASLGGKLVGSGYSFGEIVDGEIDAGDEPECQESGHDLDAEGNTDDNGIGDSGGAWEQHGVGPVGHGFTVAS